jgi:hypothetical protein
VKIDYLRRTPRDYDQGAFIDLFRDVATQLDGVSEGKIVASHNARTSAPTVGDFKQGDFIRNSAPSELGAGGSKYIIFGWVCVTSGSPGTWKQCRFLTGN